MGHVDPVGWENLVPLEPAGEDINCYRYACNTKTGPAIPGRGINPFPAGQATCANVIAGVKKDHPEARGVFPNGSCPEGMRKISIFASGNDFHFHRQDPDGYWSHKPGFGDAPICQPVRLRAPERSFYNWRYKWCGYLCINQ